jgi:tRNA(adenine34) deaminase
MTKTDEDFMADALTLAREAAAAGEVPVGAVAVLDGKTLGCSANRREMDKSPLAHAELLALAQAASGLDAWRLAGVTLYVTLEPCTMCAGALIQARIARLVFGAADPKAGAVGSLYNVLADERHNHHVAVTGGVLAEACGAVLKEFFRGLRWRAGRAVEGT